MSASTYRLGNPGENRAPLRHAKLSVFVLLFSLCLSVTTGSMAASSGATSVQAVGNKLPGTAPSLSFVNNTVAGNLIMVGIDFDGTASPSSVSDTQGNTFFQVASQLTSPEGAGSRVYYAKNIKGGADTVTVHWSVTSANVEIYLTEYAGLDPNNPVDAQAGATGPAGAVSSGLAKTSVSGDVIYGFCMADLACTAGSGFAALSTYDQNLIENNTAGGPGVYSATAFASSGWSMQMVALKPASSAGSPFVQAVGNKLPGTAPSLSFANNTMAGDLIMVGVDFDGTASPSSLSDTQGNAFIQVASQLTSPEGTGSRVYYAKNIKGGADTVTVHWSVTSVNVEIYLTEYSGLDPNNPVDAQAGARGPAGTVSSGNAGTSLSGDVIYGFCMADLACTAGSGFTARSTYDQNLIEDKIAGSPGAYAATAFANNGWSMQMVALKRAASGAATTAVTGSVTANASASLSTTSLTFAAQPVGLASAAQTITLTNTGSVDVNITGIALGGANATDFTEINTCLLPLVVGGSCNIVVLFTPSAFGTRTASLTITDNASASPQSVSLSGTAGHDVVLTWSPSAIPTYNVYRGTVPGGESSTPLNSAPINGSTFTDDNVTAGATYYYVVRAVNSNGVPTSATSNEASATVP